MRVGKLDLHCWSDTTSMRLLRLVNELVGCNFKIENLANWVPQFWNFLYFDRMEILTYLNINYLKIFIAYQT